MTQTEERTQRTGRMDNAWYRTWPIGVLALLCAAFYWDVLWLPADQIVASNDLTNMFLHWLRFAVSSIQRGQFPLWNPYLFSGVPFVANPQPALFYPPTWLALLMPVSKAFGWMVVLHTWLAGAGMYAWLRSEGASVAGALVGAAAFAFNGFIFVRVYAGHLGVITTSVWLPLLLWSYRQVMKRRSWGLAVVGGLPVGLAILAGHTASFIYVALGLLAYVAFCGWERWRAEPSARAVVLPVAWAAVMLLVGLGLAAVQLLPMAELTLRSTRQVSPSYEFAARFSWPPGYLLTLLVPNFFGEPVQTGYWGDGIYDEFIYYVGVLPLLLALLGLRLRHRLTPLLCTLGLGALLLAFGGYGSLHSLFYRFVPLFNATRAPARAGFLFTLVASGLAGLTVTALQLVGAGEEDDGRGRGREWLLRPLNRPLVLAVTAIAVALMVAGFGAFAWGRESNPVAGRLWHLANQVAVFLLFFLLAAGLLTAWRGAAPGRARSPGFVVMALSLVVLDLWTFGSGIVQPQPIQENAYWRGVSQAVADPEAMRVLPWGLNDFDQNGGMTFGLQSVFGYDPLILQRYETFITSRPDFRARTYDLLNAGYLVTAAALEESDERDAPRLLLDQSDVHVYERPSALPRAWITSQVEVMDDAAMLARIHEADFDPRTTAIVDSPLACENTVTDDVGQVEIVQYEGNRIVAQVEGGGGLLIFSEIDYPGWRAAVDGDAVGLVRVDYLLRGLCVPAGAHQVEMVYDPPLVKVGLVVTILAFLAIVGSGVFVARGKGAGHE
jgi:hypothetical protein